MTDIHHDRLAWAIMARVSRDSNLALLGHGWFGWPDKPHLLGCTTALFATRREAREAVRRLLPGGYGPVETRVVRVTVTIRGKP